MADVILTTGPLGGLGDHLLYSTLPERFTKLGFRVYLDKDNQCRNEDVFNLIWSSNPFIVDTTDRKPNIGYVNQGHFYGVAGRFPIGSIEAMERAHGLPPPYSIAPKIYYEPRPFHVALKECVLADFSAISSRISGKGISDFLVRMNDRFMQRQAYMVTFPGGVIRDQPPVTGPSIRVNTIWEYVDAIASCYGFMGSEAGGQALAAAVRGEHDVYDLVRRPEVVAVLSPKTYNSRGYTFRGVDYRVTITGDVSGDYWEPTEVPQQRYELACRHTVTEALHAWRAERRKEQEEAAQATPNAN